MSLQNGIIASSLSLSKWLNDSWVDIREFQYNPIIVKGGHLSFDGRKKYICVESKRDFISTNVKLDSLTKLKTFVSMIDEQPVTIFFEDNGWIWIKEAIL